MDQQEFRSASKDIWGIDANKLDMSSPGYESHTGSSFPTSEHTQQNSVMQKWRVDIQAAIEAKKQKEAEVMEAATKKAQRDLEEWRRVRKEKVESAAQNTKDTSGAELHKSVNGPFDWKKTAEILRKVGYTVNDQNSGSSQKMADLIFLKAKQ
ncbi:hypothetical protein BBBOND_0303530 [Babesia bigemina]|uniref:Clathrin light chain n=1 Tax=Babesia bigemina TaxID=5866 RepID=A0A061DC13_BABBI|nr:hypothetical protein BBBOND_0303530 [Babesia bigemina]CDR96449.1 hypothetical protein BBBOND_0303530 [Babesia bigemina]|eukprot:XP_012768635.1 hypothetical protein BBBOND_0303530 [Babesia bigemina]